MSKKLNKLSQNTKQEEKSVKKPLILLQLSDDAS